MTKQWTILEALEWTEQRLTRQGEENPRLAAQMLASHATGLSRIDLYAQFDRPLSESERTRLRESIQRRLEGEPLQYIIGSVGFRYLEFKVAPPVLIPRPETETLVELVLEHFEPQRKRNPERLVMQLQQTCHEHPVLPQADHEGIEPLPAHNEHSAQRPVNPEHPALQHAAQLQLLDIGTGTGVIALSLIHELSGCHVTATDIDDAATELAQQNARELKLDVGGRLHVLTDDLASSQTADEQRHSSFDAVISNPPYIPTAEYERLPREIFQFESREALDGGADGLDAFRSIAEQARILLKPGGLLAVELHEDTLEAAAAFVRCLPFEEVSIHNDLADKQRFITAIRS